MKKEKKDETGTWTLTDGRTLKLLTVEQLRALPGDARIVSITGKERTVAGLLRPDEDTRFGYTAWGIVEAPMSKPKEFNWLTRLRQLSVRKTPVKDTESTELAMRAAMWPTCACGQLCGELPRNYAGAPLDSELVRLGIQFTSAVAERYDWKEALGIFRRIEKRTAYLLRQGVVR